MIQFFFILLFVLIPIPAFSSDYLAELISAAKEHKLATKPQWLKLLHYQKTFFGGLKSQADGAGFFLSPEGKKNPEAELVANLRHFFDENIGEKDLLQKNNEQATPQHPQCLYPARYLWLKKELHFDPNRLKEIHCPRFQRFKENIAAKSVSVIFSSYYLNNPASAFGHSLLRLNKSELNSTEPRYELLDYGISYAASLTISNPVLYAIYGVFGMFPGQFTSVPYYYKVREYNDYESRDLWEYDLNLSPEQTEMITAHVWELGSTYFDYFYLSENCSYHVLSILEVGNPDLNLIDLLPSIVIPADSMRVLSKIPGLIKRIRYRPSARVQFKTRIKDFTIDQVELTKKMIQEKNIPNHVDVKVLDAVIDYVDFKHNKDLISPDSDASRWKQLLLKARSQIAITSEPLKINTPENEKPHLGHDSGRATLEYGFDRENDDHNSFTRLGFRFALHDLVDPVIGYPEYAQIEFLNTKLRYNFKSKSEWSNSLWLEDLALLKVVSLSPLTQFSKQPTWKFKIGATTIRDKSCESCLAGNLSGGAGFTLDFFNKLQLISILEADLSIAPKFDRFFLRPGVGPNLSVRVEILKDWLALINGSYQFRIPTREHHYYEYSIETRKGISDRFAFNLKAIRYPVLKSPVGEISTGLFFYF